MENLESIGPLASQFIPIAIVVVCLVIAVKVVQALIGANYNLGPGNWMSKDPELDQLFKLATSHGKLIHDDEPDPSRPGSFYTLDLRGRRRKHVRTLMSAIHVSHEDWDFEPGDKDKPASLWCPLFGVRA